MAQHLQAPFGLLHRHRRDSDDFDFDRFDSHVETVASVTMAAIIGIIVGVIVLVIVITIIICLCVCRRKRTYSGRTLYQPAPTGTTATTTATTYPAQTIYPQGYPQQPAVPYQANYPAPQYPPQNAQLPPGQAPPPYPGPPVSGYPQTGPTQTYPMATGGQHWQPPPHKLESSGYPGGMEQSHLQKASAPPPEF